MTIRALQRVLNLSSPGESLGRDRDQTGLTVKAAEAVLFTARRKTEVRR